MLNISVDRVLSRIERETGASLPSTGYLAGQAVASAIFEQTHCGLQGRFKDADVFMSGRDVSVLRKWKTVAMRSAVFLPSRRVGSFCCGSVTKGGYTIVGSWTDGATNYISLEEFDASLETVVNGFDLNAVQAGIDLATRRLYLSKSFCQFLSSRQLKIVNFCTPMHSVIRLAEKLSTLSGLDEAGVEESLLAAGSLISALQQREQAFSQWMPGCSFTDEYAKRAGAASADFCNYFTLETKTHGFYSWRRAHQLVPRSSSSHNRALDEFVHALLRVRGILVEEACAFFSSAASSAARGKRGQALVALLTECLQHHKAGCEDQVLSVVGWMIERAEQGDPVTGWQASNYLRLVHLTQRHTGLSSILDADLNVRQVMQIFADIRWLERRKHHGVIGLVESGQVDFLAGRGQWLLDWQALIETASRTFIEDVFPADDCEIDGVSVTQLITRADYLEEGSRQGHCVGGRFLQFNSSSFFTLVGKDGSRSTLEVLRMNSNYSVREHRGAYNRPPIHEHMQVADKLVGQLNRTSQSADIRRIAALILRKRAWRFRVRRFVSKGRFRLRGILARWGIVKREEPSIPF
ncbi:hypothetical protein A3709_20755 [Halioglobus sp. HI00S01]|nr:hypothetical protein A3709_20755 [Halioglobus sp. HI00S01]